MTIPAVAAEAARRFGDAPAIVEGDRIWSFRQLYDRSLDAAGAFLSAGIEKGDRIAIWAPNSADWIVACIGAQCAGAIVVTLNTRLKGKEAQYILNKSRARILIAPGNFLGQSYPALLGGLDLPHLERTITVEKDWDAFLETAHAQDRLRAQASAESLTGDDPADILFTSGTTGLPKGVVAGHGQTVQVFRVWAERVGLREGDRYLIVNPFFHTFGYKAGWLACLLVGATAYPVKTLDVAALVTLVETAKITVLPGPPAIFQSILASDVDRKKLASLRLAVTGAATIAPSLIERMRSELQIETVLTGYGLTESTGVVTLSDAGDPAEIVATRCGKPIPGLEVRCVDAEGRAAPVGVEGEVIVRGYNIMSGYFEDPDATAEAIDSEGWLHTGDVGCFDEAGYLRITDRLKDMYISGGFNCYPAEIEQVIERHPLVAQAAVIGVPDERLGEVGMAFVIPRAAAAVSPADLIAWCRAEMANYKVPRTVEIVDRLPLNAAGKVQKFALSR
jgi:acyl-CoA synthetase (AMP-forming)/AMP-acid ligase II